MNLSDDDARILLKMAAHHLLGYREWHGIEYTPVLTRLAEQLGIDPDNWSTIILPQSERDTHKNDEKQRENTERPPKKISITSPDIHLTDFLNGD